MTPEVGPCLVLRRHGAAWRADGTTEHRAGITSRHPPAAPYLHWHWDGARLLVTRDRYAVQPLFYWAGRDSFALATSIDALLQAGAPPALDEDAIAVFLRLGFYLADDTPFAAIKALPPGARIDLAGPAPLVSGSRHDAPINRLGRAAAGRGYAELFREAVRRRLHQRPGILPLSGGRDSRHMLFALLDLGQPLSMAVTLRHYAPRPDEDSRIAAIVARATGVPHVTLDEPGDRVAAELEKNRLTSYCCDEHAQYLPLARFIAGEAAPTWDGLGGGNLAGGSFQDAFETLGDPDAMTRYVLDGLDTTAEQSTRRLLTPAALRRFSRERAEGKVRAEVEQHLSTANPLTSFFLWNRMRREIALAPCAMYPAGTQVEMPFLDDELYDFLAGLPPEVTLDRRMQDEAIASAYPQYAHLPYEIIGASKPARHARRVAIGFAAEAVRLGARRWFDTRYVAATIARELITGGGQLWYVPKGLAFLQAAAHIRHDAAMVHGPGG